MDKVVFEVTRDEVVAIVGRTLTDTEWEAMADEIADFLDYYTQDEIPRLFGDIDSIVSEGN